MVKKIFIIGITAIILSLCCTVSFAANEKTNSSVNLGNEVMQSVDKAGRSMQNMTDDVFSGNMINNAKDGMTNTMNNMGNMTMHPVNTLVNEENRAQTEARQDVGNYNTVRTTAETDTAMAEFTTMSTTTWMWIILAVSAIIIIAAIWYYATQNND